MSDIEDQDASVLCRLVLYGDLENLLIWIEKDFGQRMNGNVIYALMLTTTERPELSYEQIIAKNITRLEQMMNLPHKVIMARPENAGRVFTAPYFLSASPENEEADYILIDILKQRLRAVDEQFSMDGALCMEFNDLLSRKK